MFFHASSSLALAHDFPIPSEAGQHSSGIHDLFFNIYTMRFTPVWFTLDVMRSDSRKWDWVVLLIDVPFEEPKNCTTESTSEI
jgi:hypothetical protein